MVAAHILLLLLRLNKLFPRLWSRPQCRKYVLCGLELLPSFRLRQARTILIEYVRKQLESFNKKRGNYKEMKSKRRSLQIILYLGLSNYTFRLKRYVTYELIIRIRLFVFQKVMHINTCHLPVHSYVLNVIKINCLKISLGLGWCIANTYVHAIYIYVYIYKIGRGHYNVQYLKVSMVQ